MVLVIAVMSGRLASEVAREGTASKKGQLEQTGHQSYQHLAWQVIIIMSYCSIGCTTCFSSGARLDHSVKFNVKETQEVIVGFDVRQSGLCTLIRSSGTYLPKCDTLEYYRRVAVL